MPWVSILECFYSAKIDKKSNLGQKQNSHIPIEQRGKGLDAFCTIDPQIRPSETNISVVCCSSFGSDSLRMPENVALNACLLCTGPKELLWSKQSAQQLWFWSLIVFSERSIACNQLSSAVVRYCFLVRDQLCCPAVWTEGFPPENKQMTEFLLSLVSRAMTSETCVTMTTESSSCTRTCPMGRQRLSVSTSGVETHAYISVVPYRPRCGNAVDCVAFPQNQKCAM